MAKEGKNVVVTPRVIAMFPWLTKADTKFEPEGLYQSTFILDPEDPAHAEFIEKVNGMMEAAREAAVDRLSKGDGKAKAKLKTLQQADFFKPEYDDNGDETGRMTFTVRQKRVIRFIDKKTGEKKKVIKNIIFVDSAGNVLKNPPPVYSGSELQVKGPINTYYAADKNAYGLTMKVDVVRIVELAQGSYGDAAAGFDNDGEGFVGDESNFNDAPKVNDDFETEGGEAPEMSGADF